MLLWLAQCPIQVEAIELERPSLGAEDARDLEFLDLVVIFDLRHQLPVIHLANPLSLTTIVFSRRVCLPYPYDG
jgi:hypothetical protein